MVHNVIRTNIFNVNMKVAFFDENSGTSLLDTWINGRATYKGLVYLDAKSDSFLNPNGTFFLHQMILDPTKSKIMFFNFF